MRRDKRDLPALKEGNKRRRRSQSCFETGWRKLTAPQYTFPRGENRIKGCQIHFRGKAMKKILSCRILLMAAALPLLAGCLVYERPPAAATAPAGGGTVVVEENPPPPETEVVPPPPGPVTVWVWVPGAWEWRGRWTWVPGRWQMRPHPGAVWVPGGWVQHGHARVWVEGHWR